MSVAGTRWTIETSFEIALGEFKSLRSSLVVWVVSSHYLTLLTHAFLTESRAQGVQEFFKKEEINVKTNNSLQEFERSAWSFLPLSVQEVRLEQLT